MGILNPYPSQVKSTLTSEGKNLSRLLLASFLASDWVKAPTKKSAWVHGSSWASQRGNAPGDCRETGSEARKETILRYALVADGVESSGYRPTGPDGDGRSSLVMHRYREPRETV